jgi:hypothetical protein
LPTGSFKNNKGAKYWQSKGAKYWQSKGGKAFQKRLKLTLLVDKAKRKG